jgi:hypothetical protein
VLCFLSGVALFLRNGSLSSLFLEHLFKIVVFWLRGIGELVSDLVSLTPQWQRRAWVLCSSVMLAQGQ